MKSLLVFTIALLATAVDASLAAAAGVNLSWSNCATTVASGDKSYLCDGQLGNTVAIQGSFYAPAGVSDFAGTSSVIDAAFAGPNSDYWRLESGGCDYGALLQANPSATAPCVTTNLYDPLHSGGGLSIQYPAANRIRILIDWATMPPAPAPVVAGSLYAAFKLTFDPDAGVLNGCAGCSVPGCFVLSAITVYGNTAGEEYIIKTPGDRQWVTWQGGAVGGAGCPAATPSRSPTWGAVKALYQ